MFLDWLDEVQVPAAPVGGNGVEAQANAPAAAALDEAHDEAHAPAAAEDPAAATSRLRRQLGQLKRRGRERDAHFQEVCRAVAPDTSLRTAREVFGCERAGSSGAVLVGAAAVLAPVASRSCRQDKAH